MLDRFRIRWAKRRFNSQVLEVLNTPPIRLEPANFTILSMISHDDLIMYLLAIKSFYSYLQQGKILVIDDGSLKNEDKEILNEHLCFPTIIHRETIDIGRMLHHIMWERLAYTIDLSAAEYVIQLDADTITRGPVAEVIKCIADNRAFIMGNPEARKPIPVKEAAAYAEARSSTDHIQIIAEMALARLPNAAALKYVRGSAGFVGLARDGFSRAAVEDFYLQMADLVGERLREWGSDQVAFNFLVANSPNPMVLPYPDYASFVPGLDAENVRLLHYIGTYRFRGGTYARQSREFIASAAAGRPLNPEAAGRGS